MREIKKNIHGSSYPVIVFLICLGVVAFLVLLFGHVLEPFMNLMDSEDSMIDEEISRPRGYVNQFAQIVCFKGLMLVILLGLSFGLLMEYQKIKYQQG